MLAKSGVRRFCILLAAALGAALLGLTAPPRIVDLRVETMGTVATLRVVDPDSSVARAHAAAAAAALQEVERLMSNWTDSSEVARLNRTLDHAPDAIHPEVREVVAAALAVGRESAGAFDITVEPLVRAWGFLGGSPRVPSAAEIAAALGRVGGAHVRLDARGLATTRPGLRIDLGGIAKGHAVDRARDVLRSRGVTAALIDLSGNVAVLGSPPGRGSWVVGIRDPEDRVAYFARLVLGVDAVATSADYEQFVAADGQRYGHILDPRTGWPVQELAAVTVLAPTARDADAWATAIFASGLEAGRELAQRRGDLHVILVQRPQGSRHLVWVESTLNDRFTLQPGVEDRFEVRLF